MIHQFFVIDRRKSIGLELYESEENELQISSDLLTSFLQALMQLGEEFGKSKGALREAELGKYQISIMPKDRYAYVVVHDTFDSEPFTAKIIENVISKYHPTLLETNFNQGMVNQQEIREDIKQLLQTMTFPTEKLPEVRDMIKQFTLETKFITDTMFLTDLDDGIIEIFQKPNTTEEPSIIISLMEILSEIPFERHWIGESKLFQPKKIGDTMKDYEAWIIYRIGLTDFCIMGRAYMSAYAEREQLIKRLEELTQQISETLLMP